MVHGFDAEGILDSDLKVAAAITAKAATVGRGIRTAPESGSAKIKSLRFFLIYYNSYFRAFTGIFC
jgi:hypothetical protein